MLIPIGQVNRNFGRITMGEMPENIDGWNVRGDQLYLYRMVRAVHTGVCDEKLASEKPGAMSTARWLTTASRILRYYVTCTQPSMTLKKVAEFVMKVYAPFWFLVKSQPLAIHGSRHVFRYISWIRHLPIDVQQVLRPFIANNAYFFHPENVLLSMITDQDPLVRSDGYEKILSARNEVTTCIRQMFGPQVDNFINFESDSYVDMINWNKFHLTEPPCLQFYTQDQLEDLQSSNEIIELPGKNTENNLT